MRSKQMGQSHVSGCMARGSADAGACTKALGASIPDDAGAGAGSSTSGGCPGNAPDGASPCPVIQIQ